MMEKTQDELSEIRERHENIVLMYGGEPWDESCVEDGEQAHMDREALLRLIDTQPPQTPAQGMRERIADKIRDLDIDNMDAEQIADALLPLCSGEWRGIEPADIDTIGWLYSPAKNLHSHPFSERWKGDDIRVSRPRDWTWATMIIPLKVPAPPAAQEG